MRVDIFEIILSETSEICLFFFGISLGYDGETNILNESSVAAFRCFSALQMLIFMTSELKIRKNGLYWSSSCLNPKEALGIYFSNSFFYHSIATVKCSGRSVRLVRDK
jgi:hypothetical protein